MWEVALDRLPRKSVSKKPVKRNYVFDMRSKSAFVGLCRKSAVILQMPRLWVFEKVLWHTMLNFHNLTLRYIRRHSHHCCFVISCGTMRVSFGAGPKAGLLHKAMWKKIRLIFWTLLFLIFVASLPVAILISKRDLIVEELWSTPYGPAERANYGWHWDSFVPKKQPQEIPRRSDHYHHWNIYYHGAPVKSFEFQY